MHKLRTFAHDQLGATSTPRLALCASSTDKSTCGRICLQVGFKNARKSQPAAAEKAADELARRALTLGYSSVVVKLKGSGSNKQVAVQSLHAAGLRIKTLMDVTGIPYNGCRAPKRRRV